MLKNHVEVIIINSSAKPFSDKGFSLGYKESFAPFGLCCLSELAPDRIAVVDIQFSYPAEDFFAHLEKDKIKTIIFRAGKNHEEAFLVSSVKMLKALFPNALVGLSGAINKAFVNLGDFFIYGTGHKTILNALRGERLTGFINSMEADLELILPVPQNAFVESYCYDAQPEKIITRRTYEVFQPWLGLFEFSNRLETYPGLNWMSSLGKWMRMSGMKELHFRPSGLTPDDLHELRSVMLNLGIEFSVSFKKFVDSDLENNCAGEPLKQVWLYNPNPENAHHYLKGLKLIAKAGCKPCISLNSEAIEAPELAEILSTAVRMSLIDMEAWELSNLKKVFLRFWGAHNRFFRRLFSIRTANELIGFMKTASVTLEILFSKEKKAGKK